MVNKNADTTMHFKNGEANIDSLYYCPIEVNMSIQVETKFETDLFFLEMAGIELLSVSSTTSKYIREIDISTTEEMKRVVELKMMNGVDSIKVICSSLFYG